MFREPSGKKKARNMALQPTLLGLEDKGFEEGLEEGLNFVTGQAREGSRFVAIRSASIDLWCVQRLDGEYRVWLRSSNRRPSAGLIKAQKKSKKSEQMTNLWYCLRSQSSDRYKEVWKPLQKRLRDLKPLLASVGRGPPAEEGFNWDWPRWMKFDDIDASIILADLDLMQPGARELLEANPQFVKSVFLETLEESEYAGISRTFCNPKGKTLEEYFDYCIEHGRTPPIVGAAKRQKKETSDSVDGIGEIDLQFDDETKAERKHVIKCSECGGRTRHYEERAGIQHYVIMEGKRIKLDKSPNCTLDDESNVGKRKGARKKGSAVQQQSELVRVHGSKRGVKNTGISHSYGLINCIACKAAFSLPEDASKMEQHLQKHVQEEQDEKVSFANQVRLRSIAESLF